MDIGKISGKTNTSGINDQRLSTINRITARIRLINPFSYRNIQIDIEKTLKETMRIPMATTTLVVQGPYDAPAKSILKMRIEFLIKANYPKVNIKARAEAYALDIIKIATVAETHNIFESLDEKIKQLVIDNVFYSRNIAVNTVITEDKPSAIKKDEIEDYYDILTALQKCVLDFWHKAQQQVVPPCK